MSSEDTRSLHLHQQLVQLSEALIPQDWQALAEMQAALQAFRELADSQGIALLTDIGELHDLLDRIILEQEPDMGAALQRLRSGVAELIEPGDPSATAATADDLSQRIEQLAGEVVCASCTDWQALSALQQHFSAIAEITDQAHIAESCRDAHALIDQIILEQLSDGDAAMVRLQEVVATLQSGNAVAPAALHSSGTDPTANRPVASGRPTASDEQLTHLSNAMLQEFVQQQQCMAEEIEGLLLTLEQRRDTSAADQIRRLIHTFKGEAGILGLEDFNQWAHRIEDLLAQQPAHRATQVLFQAIDWLRSAVEDLPRLERARATLPELFQAIDQALHGKGGHNDPPAATDQLVPTDELPDQRHRAIEVSKAEDEILSADTRRLSEASDLPRQADVDTLREFINEAQDHLQAVEASLLALEHADGVDLESINAVFRGFHTIKGLAGFLDLRREQTLAHATEELLDQVRSERMPLSDRVVQIVFKALDQMRFLIDSLSQATEGDAQLPAAPDLPNVIAAVRYLAQGQSQRLGEILLESHSITRRELQEALDQQQIIKRPVGEILVGSGKIDRRELTRAVRKQQVQRQVQGQQTDGNTGTRRTQKPVIMKVDAERIDNLADIIGELVVAQGMLSEADPARPLGARDVQALIGRFERITRNLQDMATNLRMVPVGPVFQRMARVVRDLARKLDKPIQFHAEGSDVELDKTLVDRLGDPLVHMVRNAVDHGLETNADERIANDKSQEGHVTLRAFHEGGHIHIEVSDDGRGLDRDRILAKAIERGLVRSDQQISDQEINYLIFQPGFSTASSVTDVSGRGVGMDVVKRMVEDLRGQILIRSVPGEGSTFTYVLPLTAAIIDGMLITVAGRRYIVPTLSIVTSLRPREEEIQGMLGSGRLLELQGHQLPVYRMVDLLDLPTDEETSAVMPKTAEDETSDEAIEDSELLASRQRKRSKLALVVSDGSHQIALLVDALLGRQQVVIKPLGDGIPKIAGISGATITGDGRVCLILDIGGLVRFAATRSNKPAPVSQAIG